MKTINIKINHFRQNSKYKILIGYSIFSHLEKLFNSINGINKIMMIYPESLKFIYKKIYSIFNNSYEIIDFVVPERERAKSKKIVFQCWEKLGKHNFTRSDIIIALGGGSVTDVSGFIASTWLRGIKVILIPTSLLCMVDASIGGKTGINTVQGKNLVGSFYLPTFVIIDLSFLKTLPFNELKNGLAEIIKIGFIKDRNIISLIEKNIHSLLKYDLIILRKIIEKSVYIKSKITSFDFQENNNREILNYGHTLGHAIELVENYSWKHGDAISIGMIFAAKLSNKLGYLNKDILDKHHYILNLIKLPTSYSNSSWHNLFNAIKIDKKSRGDSIRFVILKNYEKPIVSKINNVNLLKEVYKSLR